MPPITHNTLSLSGERANVQKFKKAVKGGNGALDLSRIGVMSKWYEAHPEWNARNIKTKIEDEYIYSFDTIWDVPRPLVKAIVEMAHDLDIYVEWEAMHSGTWEAYQQHTLSDHYEEYEIVFTEYSVGRQYVDRCHICEAAFCKKGLNVPGELQTFEGYTVDFRSKQFRKVEPDGYIDFVDFASDKGQELETRMHIASMEALSSNVA